MSECKQEIRVNDIGTQIEIEVLENCAAALNLDTASVKTIHIKRPDATVISRTAIFLTDGTDGIIYILSIAGDLTLEGTYSIQAYLELPTWQGYSNIGEFEVYENLV